MHSSHLQQQCHSLKKIFPQKELLPFHTLFVCHCVLQNSKELQSLVASSSSTHVHSQQCSPPHAPNRYWIDALQEIRNWSKICIVCNFNYFPMLLCLRVLFISWEEVFLSKSLWHNDVRNGLRFEALNWWSCGGCKREIKEEREKNELLVPLEITFDDAARWSEAMPVVYVVEWLFLLKVAQVCTNCGVRMGEYFCNICKFFDDDVRGHSMNLQYMIKFCFINMLILLLLWVLHISWRWTCLRVESWCLLLACDC